MGGTEIGEQREPVRPGQREVEEREASIGVLIDQAAAGFRRVRIEHLRRGRELGEDVAQRFEDQRMVVDHQDLDRAGGAGREPRRACGWLRGERVGCGDHG